MKKTLLLFITLLSITITNAQTVADQFTAGDYTYEVTAVGTPNEVKVVGYTATALNIPATVNDGTYDYTVTLLPSGVFNTDLTITSVTSLAPVTIALQSFNACKNITFVDLPNAISIENSAFLNCILLETVDIQNVTGSLGNATFKNCSKLTTIDARKANAVGNETFRSAVLLTTVDLRSALTAGNKSFFKAGPLTNADFSAMTSFDQQSFKDCAAVSLSFPELIVLGAAELKGTALIKDGLVFWQSDELESISIPKVEEINVGAFNGCTALKSITFPSTLRIIDQTNYNMFRGCTSLTEVIIEYTTPIPLAYNLDAATADINPTIFGTSSGDPVVASTLATNATLTVPNGTLSNYQSLDVWKDFGTIIEASVLNVSSQEKITLNSYPNPVIDKLYFSTNDVFSAEVYTILGAKVSSQKVIDGIDLSQLNKGIYFVKAKNNEGLDFKTIKVIKQ